MIRLTLSLALAMQLLALSPALADASQAFDLDCKVSDLNRTGASPNGPFRLSEDPHDQQRIYFKIDLATRRWCEVFGSDDPQPACPAATADRTDNNFAWGWFGDPPTDVPAQQLSDDWAKSWRVGDWLLNDVSTDKDHPERGGIDLARLEYVAHFWSVEKGTNPGDPDWLNEHVQTGPCQKLAFSGGF